MLISTVGRNKGVGAALPLIFLMLIGIATAAVDVSCSITYPPGTPYTTMCNAWQQINMTAVDNESITAVRNATCARYYQNGTAADTISQPYLNGTSLMFNFSLTENDSGTYFAYNCSCNATNGTETGQNYTQTLNATVVGIGTTVCSLTPPDAAAQTDTTILWVVMAAAFFVMMLYGGLSIFQTGYMVLLLFLFVSVFGYNMSEEVGFTIGRYAFEALFILSALLFMGATVWYLFSVGKQAMEIWKQKRL